MNSIKFNQIQSWSLCKTLDATLNECINASVVILPIEKYKLLKFRAQTLVMSSSS